MSKAVPLCHHFFYRRVVDPTDLMLSGLSERTKGVFCRGENVFITHLSKRFIEHRTSMQEAEADSRLRSLFKP